jgi:hypothetical protein
MYTTGLWVDVEDIIAYLGSDAPAPDDIEGQARLENAAVGATELLYSLSGRKFPGIVEATVWPTPFYNPGRATLMPNPYWGYCFGSPHTRCEAPKAIGLGRSPLQEIIEIVIDGVELDAINYRIDNQKWLVRNDCYAWPMCGCTCDGFSVKFKWGESPPQLGVDAALILAAEMYRFMTPGTTCRLPARLSSITRQGVSMALIDPMDFMEKGLTGVYQVDMFLQAFNPGKQIRKPIVFSPDVNNFGRRQTDAVINPLVRRQYE